MMVAAISFFHVPIEARGVVSAEALRQRLEAVPLQTVDGAVMTAAMAVPLLIAGFGALMMEVRGISRSERVALWAGAIGWVLTLGAFVAALRMVSAGVAQMGGEVVWPPELLATLEWLAWIPGGLTLALWGGIGVWVGAGRAPVPAGWARYTPIVWMLFFWAVASAARWVVPSIAAMLYTAAPWAAFGMSTLVLMAYRWNRPIDDAA